MSIKKTVTLQIATEFNILKAVMKEIIYKVDSLSIKYMKIASIPAIRLSFGIIFFWFGILKPLHLSPAESLLKATVVWLPFGSPEQWLIAIGLWEVIIGIFFLFEKTTKLAIILLLIQMVGTFMPLIFLTDVTFQSGNFLLPTMEGQYIIKNLMIISAALVLGGQTNRKKTKNRLTPLTEQ